MVLFMLCILTSPVTVIRFDPRVAFFFGNIGHFSFSNVHFINLEILLSESHVRIFWKHRARLAFVSWWSAGEVTGWMGRVLTSSHFNKTSYVELLINISLENLGIASLDSLSD